MNQLDLGNVRIHRIEEWAGQFLTPQLLFAGFNAEDYASCKSRVGAAYLDPASDAINARLQSWVIEIAGATILIDTGAGNDKVRPGIPVFGNLKTPFLERLTEAGFPPEAFDFIVCTHLHIDHVGWNTRRTQEGWVPTFPNARYIFSQADAEFWNPANINLFPDKIGEEVNAGFFDDSVAPILDRGLAELVSGNFELMPGVNLAPAPGHTPGSMTITVRGTQDTAVFIGDIIHHPLQILHPEWNSIFCEDQAQARQTRLQTLEKVAALEAIMIPAHFAGDHVTRVVRSKPGFSFEPA